MMDGTLINTTMLNSTDVRCMPFIKEDPVSTKAIKAISYIVMMLLSLLGNAAVIAIIAKNKITKITLITAISVKGSSDMELKSFLRLIADNKGRKHFLNQNTKIVISNSGCGHKRDFCLKERRNIEYSLLFPCY